MSSQTDAASNVFEQVMESFRKTAEITLSAQRDFFQQWQGSWPGIASPQTPWLDQIREFQRTWSNTVVELARKHRETLDRQYQAGIDALQEAFHVSESTDPEEFRKRAEKLCRKNLDCLKEISEAQIQEFQTATAKWVELLTKGAPPAKPSSGK